MLIGAGIVQGVFLAVILYRRKSGNRFANLYLSVLLAAFSLNIIHTTFIREFFAEHIPHGFTVYEPFQLLIGPLIFLYARSLINPRIKPGKKDLIHFLPFLIYLFLSIPIYLLTRQPLNQAFLSGQLNPIIWAAIILYLLVYMIQTGRLIHAHDKVILAQFSSTEKINLQWVRYFLVFFLIITIVNFILLFWMIHGDPYPYFFKILSLTFSIGVYTLGYKGLTQPVISTQPAASKYEKSGLSQTQAEESMKSLLNYMEEEKPYLDPELNLTTLSDMTKIPRNILSQIINELLRKNFYDFINQYRIEEFQRRASDPKNRNLKILSLAFDSGFNSKPAFNSVFKKLTGTTPSAHLKSQKLP